MKRRKLLLPAVFMAHLLMFGVALRPGIATPLAATGEAIRVAEISPDPVVPAIPPSTVEIVVHIDVLAPALDIEQEPALGEVIGSQCDLTGSIQAALVAENATAPLLETLPIASRSVANAIMVWDGKWASESADGYREIDRIRRVVLSRIATAPIACRNALIIGPRLIFVPDGSKAAVLAFGSGNWAWSQLTI